MKIQRSLLTFAVLLAFAFGFIFGAPEASAQCNRTYSMCSFYVTFSTCYANPCTISGCNDGKCCYYESGPCFGCQPPECPSGWGQICIIGCSSGGES